MDRIATSYLGRSLKRLSLTILHVWIFSLAFSNSAFATVDSYTAATTTNWVAPVYVYSVQVECWGGGGGGGNSNNTTTNGGSGGGGGAYSKSTLSVTPATSYSLTVGAGGPGAPASSTNPATVGGDSSFGAASVVCKGGGLGLDNSTVVTAGGASASGTGTIKYSGGNGGGGGGSGGGGGGSSAGTAAGGGNGTTGSGGAGGTAPAGGGNGGAGSASTNGVAGTAPGGGGGGSNDAAATKGGDGAVGKILLTYTVDPNAPTANAGVDVHADDTDGTASLNGTASTDVEPSTLTYAWTETADATNSCSLVSSNIASPTVNITDRSSSYFCTFNLVVNDGVNNSVADSVLLGVSSPEDAPTANAGVDLSHADSSPATLNASASTGTSLSYSWAEIADANSLCTLSGGGTTATPTISLVQAPSESTCTYRVTVTDASLATSTDDVVLTVTQEFPTANAGIDINANDSAGSTSLNGTASSDPNDDELTYLWSETADYYSGCTLATSNVASPTVTILDLGFNYSCTFNLTVNDGDDDSAADTVVLNVTEAGGDTFCVDSVADPGAGVAGDCAATCDGTNDCALRDALAAAGSGDGIIFKPALGQIDPTATLTIAAGVTLDAGPNHDVRIDGTGTAGISCLTVGGNGVTIRGFVITNCANGIHQSGAYGNTTIQGNWVGLSTDGTTTVANSTGIRIASGTTGILIGTNGDGVNDAAERNVVGGQASGSGIAVGVSASTGKIKGNYIGINVAGTAAKANFYGVYLSGTGSWIVGTDGDGTGDTVEGNYIAGNSDTGVNIDNTGAAVIAGNIIGLDVAGTARSNNIGIRTFNSASGTNYRYGTNGDGVSDAAERNIISGNTTGITATTGGGKIKGNYIGLASDGSTVKPNGTGISITSSSVWTIGTEGDGIGDANEGNVISGNTGTGVSLTSDNKIIAGNYIGVAANGISDKGNGTHGIYLSGDTDTTVIGGDIAAESNMIAFNGDAASEYGVYVANATADSNQILRNNFHDNQNAGIALIAGANNDNAAPASITSSTADTPTHDVKKLSSGAVTAGGTVQVFEADDGASCEGERYIGQATADGAGAWSYNLTGADNNTGVILVLTETDAANGTSPFSACFTLTNLTPTANAGSDVTAYDTNGSVNTAIIGGTSSDPEGTNLTYTWTETDDSTGSCSPDNLSIAQPTLTLTDRASTYTCSYSLTVGDGTNTSVADSVLVTINDTGSVPTANAGTDISVNESAGSTNLNGTASSDPEAQPLTYSWTETSDSTASCVLGSATAAQPAVTLANWTSSYSCTYSLTVSDGGNTSTADTVDVNVTADNDGPTAHAGSDQAVNETAGTATLTGLASSDPESQSLTYAWSETADETGSCSINNTALSQPTVTLSDSAQHYTCTYSLTVNDGTTTSSADTMVISVTDSVGAQTICVDDVSAAGSNIYDCQTACTGVSDNCSLGDAISAATSGDTIIFKSALGQIDPTSTYTIPTGVTVNAGTNHDVRIDGTGTAGIDCLTVGGNSVTIKGLVLTNCNRAISMTARSGVKIQNNWAGLSIDGSTIVPNAYGVYNISATSANTIGTDGDGVNDSTEGNVLSGNTSGTGIYMWQSDNQIVAGNIIGLNPAGTTAKANNYGMYMENSADNNRIGTNGDGIGDTYERNVISGNTNQGIYLRGPASAGNKIAGNYIGVGSNGLSDLGNGKGVEVGYSGGSAGANTIGTDGNGSGDASERNVIAGNTTYDVYFNSGGASSVVAGNYIGLGSDGSTVLTGGYGIFVSSVNSVRIGTNGNGVSDTDERNVIGGGTYGIYLNIADSCTIAGNYIGVATDGTTDKGTTTQGIYLAGDSDLNIIGGDIAAETNIIAYNGNAASEYGIYNSSSTADQNQIIRNNFHDNQNAGIALAVGANNDNAAPASITSSTATTPTHDVKKLSSGAVTASATVQIFEADDGASCEGERYIGQATADGAGAWSYNLTGTDNNAGVILVLTETDAANGTSPFSSCYTLTNLTPTANAGSDVAANDADLTATLNGTASTDPEGTNLSYSWTETADASGSCSLASNNVAQPVVNMTDGTADFTCTFSLTVGDGTNTSAGDTVVLNVTNTGNTAPTANAGIDQNVNDSVGTVNLDGTGSSDPELSVLTYSWSETGDTNTQCALNDPTNDQPTVTITNKASGGTCTFSLTVNDGSVNSAADTMTVTITGDNDSPTANAGSDANINETAGSTQLDGTSSSDPEGSALTYTWSETADASGKCSGVTNVAQPTVTVAEHTTSYACTYQLVVNDGVNNSAGDSMTINVTADNDGPTANAGADQNKNETDGTATLNGTGSSDPEGQSLTYTWSETVDTLDGCSLGSTNVSQPVVTLSDLGENYSCTFSLTVSDGTTTSAADTMVVNVTDASGVQTFCVDSTADPGSGVAGDCQSTCTGMGDDCALRDALAAATSGDTVIFKSALGQIDPTATLTVPAGVTVNGGSSHDIRIDGTGTSGIDCLTVGGNTVTIKGLVITNCRYGIYNNTYSGLKVQNNYIGLSTDGSTVVGNSFGVYLMSTAAANTIGTDGDGVGDSTEGNVLSGNSYGVRLNNADNQVIAGNIIGLNAAGDTAKANTTSGIYVGVGSASNRIGTNGDSNSDSSERNVISGNSLYGIYVTGAGSDLNTIAGNYIGVGSNGTTSLGNGAYGIDVASSAGAQTIGTNGDGVGDVAERNIIGGSGTNDIAFLSTGANSIVAGNYIGLGSDGSTEITGGNTAIVVSGVAVRIGTNGDGTADSSERNVIGGSGLVTGIVLSSADASIVAGNYIGVASNGTTDKGTTSVGIDISGDTDGAVIGGDSTAEANIIGYNGSASSGNGLSITTGTADLNQILRNNFHDNEMAGISLLAGANNDNAAPANITSSTADTPTSDAKKLTSDAVSANATVQIFEADDNSSCEGERYIGQATADGAGAWSYNLTGADNNTGTVLVLTETDAANGTSPFSVCYTLTNLAPTAVAGNDQSVAETAGTVSLSGTGSNDPEGTVVTYLWSETADASTACSLSSTTASQPTVTILDKIADYTCTYQLVVNDGTNNSAGDSVTINVAADNDAPTADAGSNVTPNESDGIATLDGRASSDPENQSLTYTWSETADAAGGCTINDTSLAQPTITLANKITNYTCTYSLTVSDGTTTSASDSIDIIVTADNDAPTANAGSDANINESAASASLDGTSSSDPEGQSLTYTWSETADASSACSINTASLSQPTVTVTDKTISYSCTYSLTVSDGTTTSAGDSMTINVTADDDAPSLGNPGAKSVNEGVLLSFSLSGSDPEGLTLSYSCSANCPSGLSVDGSTGAVTWTPNYTQSGTYNNVTFRVADPGNNAATRAITITVGNTDTTPSLVDPGNKRVKVGTLLSFTLSGSDADGDTLTYTCSANCPSGLAVDSSTGAVTWTPAANQTGTAGSVTFKVADSQANEATRVIDIDVGAITLTEAGGITTVTEGGATDTISVVLTALPTGNVTVDLTITGSDIDVDVDQLIFTTADWNTPQTVTVSAIEDDLDETETNSISYTVTSGDALYTGYVLASTTVTIVDNDTAGVSVTASGGTTAVSETGTTDTYTVVLTSEPTNDVIITLTGNADITLNQTTLTFTSANWDTAQTVTVGGVNDSAAEGTETVAITHTAASIDAGYNAIAVSNLNVDVSDDDAAGVTVTQSDGSTTVDDETSDTYTVVLNSQPTSNVVVTISAGSGASVSATTLTFTAANWNTAQTVTVEKSGDVDQGTATITHTVASVDSDYQGISAGSVVVTIEATPEDEGEDEDDQVEDEDSQDDGIEGVTQEYLQNTWLRGVLDDGAGSRSAVLSGSDATGQYITAGTSKIYVEGSINVTGSPERPVISDPDNEEVVIFTKNLSEIVGEIDLNTVDENDVVETSISNIRSGNVPKALANGSGNYQVMRSSQPGDGYGRYVTVGDVNHNGLLDILVAAPGSGEHGVVYVYSLNGVFRAVIFGSAEYPIHSVMAAGGSSNKNIIFGPDNLAMNSNLVRPDAIENMTNGFLLNGGAGIDGMIDLADTGVDLEIGSGSYGAMASGDVNGDGEMDLVLSHIGTDVQIYFGPSMAAADVTIAGAHAEYGSIITVDDVNNDGIDDILIGDPSAGDGEEGAIHIVWGRESWNATMNVSTSSGIRTLTGLAAGDRIGEDLAVIVGAESTEIYTLAGDNGLLQFALTHSTTTGVEETGGGATASGAASGGGCSLTPERSAFPFWFLMILMSSAVATIRQLRRQ